MSANEDDNWIQKWQSTVDDLHGEIDLEDPMLNIEVEDTNPGDQLEITEVTITRPILVDGDEDPIEVTRRVDTAEGEQVAVTIRKQLRCPSCHYFPQHDLDDYDEPPELKGWCRGCHTLTCTECRVEPSCCERDLCSDCSQAFFTEDGPLCSEHKQERVEERNYQRKLEIWEQRRKDKELHLRYELEYLSLELESRLKEQQQRLQAFIEQWNHIDRITKRQIEKKQAELGHMLKRREQALKEFSKAAEVQLRREAQALKERKHEDQQRIRERMMTLREQEAQFNQYIQEERLELRKANQLLHSNNAGSHQKLENMGKAANQLKNRNRTPPITVK